MDAQTYPIDLELRLMLLVGSETENPEGAETLTAKLDELQPESLFVTFTAYLSGCPGIPQEPQAAHA
jgi:hypothetical protein